MFINQLSIWSSFKSLPCGDSIETSGCPPSADDGHDRARKHGEARGERGELPEPLHVHRNQHEYAVNRDAHGKHAQHAHGEIPVFKNPHIKERLFRVELDPDKQRQGYGENNYKREDEIRLQPAVFLPLAQKRDKRAESDSHGDEAGQVKGFCRPILFARFPEQHDRENGADDADGQVHVKNPAPAQVFGYDAAQRGPHGRRAARPEAVDAKGQPPLLFRKHLAENHHADGHDNALTQALAEPGDVHHADAGRLAADRGTDGEDDKTQQVRVAVPQHRGQPPRAGHADGRSDEIGNDDPLHAVGVGIEGGHHLRQHHVHDGAVQKRDEDADHHDKGGGPF